MTVTRKYPLAKSPQREFLSEKEGAQITLEIIF